MMCALEPRRRRRNLPGPPRRELCPEALPSAANERLHGGELDAERIRDRAVRHVLRPHLENLTLARWRSHSNGGHSCSECVCRHPLRRGCSNHTVQEGSYVSSEERASAGNQVEPQPFCPPDVRSAAATSVERLLRHVPGMPPHVTGWRPCSAPRGAAIVCV